MSPKTLARYKNQARRLHATVLVISEFYQILRRAELVFFLHKMWLVQPLAPPLNLLVKGRRSQLNQALRSSTQRPFQAKNRGNLLRPWPKRRLDLELWGHRRKDKERQGKEL